MCKEVLQWRAAANLWSALSSLWNVIDACCYLCFALSTCLFIALAAWGSPAAASEDALALGVWQIAATSTACNCFATMMAVCAVNSVLLWSRLLHYMCAFSTTGPLVSMLLQICKEIRYFMLLVLCMSIGFGIAFYLLFVSSGSADAQLFYGSVPRTAVTMLSMMTGAFDQLLFFEATTPALALVLLAVYVLLMMVVLFNLLIAIMSSTYEQVRFRMETYALMLSSPAIITLSRPTLRAIISLSRPKRVTCNMLQLMDCILCDS
jgi:hypothetical protein